MKATTYKIADLYIRVEYDFSYEMPDGNAIDFKVDSTQADFTYYFKKTDHIQSYLEGAVRLKNTIVYDLIQTKNYGIIAGFVYENQFYDAVTIYDTNSATIYYIDENTLLKRYQTGYNYFNYLCLERMFPLFDALVLHSSHMDIGNKALLFSAPSQGGKSTQAGLWESQGLCKVINGDRSVLRKINGVWYACGCPMCGTSGIHVNSLEPMIGLVMLEKGLNNTLTRLTGRRAFMEVYPQITTPTELSELVNKNLDLLSQFMEEIPIYYYSCTKEVEAVYTLKEKLGV